MPTIEPLCNVDVSPLVAFLEGFPEEDWRRIDSGWHDWTETFRPLAQHLVNNFYPHCFVSGMGLFLLEPGQHHPTHKDIQPPQWVTRIHVPIITNEQALAWTDEGRCHMAVGMAYLFNTRENHAVGNEGKSPRIHFVFDVHH